MPNFYTAERNLNPKAACLKRREEEKVETDVPMTLNSGEPQQRQEQVTLADIFIPLYSVRVTSL